jgi:hypothetical protein
MEKKGKGRAQSPAFFVVKACSGRAHLFDRLSDIGFLIDPHDQLAIRRMPDDKTLNGNATSDCNGSQHLILPQEAKLWSV